MARLSSYVDYLSNLADSAFGIFKEISVSKEGGGGVPIGIEGTCVA